MDREIPKEVRVKERNKRMMKFGGIGAGIIVCMAVLISLMQSSVKRRDIVLSTVDSGTIEVSVSA
jgi:HlyD family secretion protein